MIKKGYTQNYKVQIPIKKEIAQQVETIAKEIGFDSTGALTRFLYTKLIKKELNVSLFKEPVEYLTPKQEEHYLNIQKKQEEHRKKYGVKSYTDSKELIADLNNGYFTGPQDK